ncbi:MAG: hypothetical protein QOC71_1993 [Thermoplasmata archaeon]|nr:hypothetical protein [Thermoplasmata archaeon]
MRILFTSSYGVPFGGAEHYAFGVAERLRDRGHEVRMLASQAATGAGTLADYTAISASEDLDERPLRRAMALGVRKTAKAVATDFRPELVHHQNFFYLLGPAVLGAFGKTPQVATAHDYSFICPRGDLFQNDERQCPHDFGTVCVASRCISVGNFTGQALKRAELRLRLGRVAAAIFPSRHSQARHRLAGFDVPGVHIPNAVDPALYASGSAPSASSIAFAGMRLEPAKGVDAFLALARSLAQHGTDLRFRLAGVGSRLEQARQAAAQPPLAGRVDVLGRLSREDYLHDLRTCRLFLVPSLWEEITPLTVLEAMAASRPVVAFDAGGVHEHVEHGRTGLLVPVGDVQAMAEAVRTLEDDPGLADEMGRRGLDRVQREFTLDKHVDALERFYEQVLEGQGFGRVDDA